MGKQQDLGTERTWGAGPGDKAGETSACPQQGQEEGSTQQDGEVAWVDACLGQTLGNSFTFPNNPTHGAPSPEGLVEGHLVPLPGTRVTVVVLFHPPPGRMSLEGKLWNEVPVQLSHVPGLNR